MSDTLPVTRHPGRMYSVHDTDATYCVLDNATGWACHCGDDEPCGHIVAAALARERGVPVTPAPQREPEPQRGPCEALAATGQHDWEPVGPGDVTVDWQCNDCGRCQSGGYEPDWSRAPMAWPSIPDRAGRRRLGHPEERT